MGRAVNGNNNKIEGAILWLICCFFEACLTVREGALRSVPEGFLKGQVRNCKSGKWEQ